LSIDASRGGSPTAFINHTRRPTSLSCTAPVGCNSTRCVQSSWKKISLSRNP